ncbi:hypothetical protein [Microvirga splendida]|uniref:NurA domain-containing protein n=1 Tax=Microvirga splendida TaxID=2795727 RepID=A0ABS0XXP2_9HYPH|nr:hypothetical protein [Microvirga splendida]MBJ6124817.1 hypothetical protein [Microvirga splendida]
MPYDREPSSPTGGFDVMKQPVVLAFMDKARVGVNLADRGDSIRTKVIDVKELVREMDQGLILASDASPYEAIAKKDFPSIRVGLLKFSNVLIKVPDYKRLRDRNEIFVDPVDIANLKKAAGSLSFALPGAGITSDAIPKTKTFFRSTVFDIFRDESLTCQGITLYDTLVDLIRRSGSIVTEQGREGIVLSKDKKSPIDGMPLGEKLFVPVDPGYVDVNGDSAKRVFVTDALRVQDVFSEEGSNTECFSRLMSAMEHILVAHIIRCAHINDPTSTGNMHVIIDGPLAIFGESARFHRGIMSLLDEVRTDCRSKGLNGPLVIGVSKTGKVVEHATMIERILQCNPDGTEREGTFLLPIDDDYRYSIIEANVTNNPNNFGDETYYGQTFIVRTSRGKIFDVTLAYPFARKADVDGVAFREAKMDLKHYGADLSRMISLIEMMQTDLFANALIPIHLAHRYASIAHAPGGRSLDAFVRDALKISR